MQIIRFAFKLLEIHVIKSQFFVALCATALSIFFMKEQGAYTSSYAFLVFITFWAGYIYTKYQNRVFQHDMVWILLGLFFSSIIILFGIEEKQIIVKWLILVVLGLLYNSQFLKFKARNLPFLKILYVGIVWSLACTWLVVPKWNFFHFLLCTLWITVLILPFDIKDASSDDIKTFPKQWGISATKRMAYLILFILGFMGLMSFSTSYFLSFGVAILVAVVWVKFSGYENTEIYYTIGVESCNLIPLFILCITDYLKIL